MLGVQAKKDTTIFVVVLLNDLGSNQSQNKYLEKLEEYVTLRKVTSSGKLMLMHAGQEDPPFKMQRRLDYAGIMSRSVAMLRLGL